MAFLTQFTSNFQVILTKCDKLTPDEVHDQVARVQATWTSTITSAPPQVTPVRLARGPVTTPKAPQMSDVPCNF